MIRLLTLRARTAGSCAIAVALLLAVPPTAKAASVSHRLHHARSNLAKLTGQIKAQEATVNALAGRVHEITAEIDAAAARSRQISYQLSVVRHQISVATAQYDRYQGQLNQVARNAYMQQAGGQLATFVTMALGARSMTEMSDGTEYSAAIGQSVLTLANQVAALKASLAVKAGDLRRLEAQQTALLTQLAQQRQTQAQALADQQKALADLAHTRGQIVQVVGRLQKKLRAEQLAVVGLSFQGGAHATYGQWADLFLRAVTAPTCHSNEIVVVAWQLSEFTQAAWNPLATTLVVPGSTDFNSAGVQNYPSLQEGLGASRATIEGGSPTFGYGAILSALGRCSAPMTTAGAINASSWCSGCAGGAYVTGNVAKVAADYELYANL